MRLDNEEWIKQLKLHLHALKKLAQHSQLSTFKRIGPKCSLAPALKIWRALLIFLARVNSITSIARYLELSTLFSRHLRKREK